MPKSNKLDKSIEDSGERMVPAYHKHQLVYGEHMVRYEAARSLAKGRVVLDIASGSGYGSALLENEAKKVYGVDINDEAVKYAQANYGSPKTEFLQGDGVNIPLEDNSVDLIICFETLEHIEDYTKFMAELKRVIRDDGLLLLSTPNDKEFPEGADFHVHEFQRDELKKLVSKYFSNTKEYFQVTWQYNALLDEEHITNEGQFNVDTHNLAPVDLDKVLYFYMLCSNKTITEVIEPIGALSEHWSTKSMLEHNADMDQYIRDTIKHFDTALETKDKELVRLRDLEYQFHQLKTSRSFKVSQRISRVKKKITPKNK